MKRRFMIFSYLLAASGQWIVARHLLALAGRVGIENDVMHDGAVARFDLTEVDIGVLEKKTTMVAALALSCTGP